MQYILWYLLKTGLEIDIAEFNGNLLNQRQNKTTRRENFKLEIKVNHAEKKTYGKTFGLSKKIIDLRMKF